MKKLRLLLFIALTLTLTACGSHKLESDRLVGEGYDIIITYNANGGSFGSEISIKYIYAKEGTIVPPPGETTLASASLAGYNIEGWYTASYDENKKPLEDDHGNIILDKKWDFTKEVNESMTLYAKWQKNYIYNVNFLVESLSDGSLETSDYTQQFIVNEEDKTFMGSIDNQISRVNYSGHTVVDIYTDKECTTLWDNSFIHPYSDSQTSVEVYAKVLKGKFIFANDAEDFKNMKTTSCYYLKNDIDFAFTDELDEDGNKVLLNFEDYINFTYFGGKIVGNGYKLQHINYNVVDPKASNLGLFNELINAELYDVTFESCNVNIKYTKRRFNDLIVNIGFLGGKLTSSILENVKVENCNLQTTIIGDFDVNFADNSKYDNGYAYGIISSSTPVTTIVDFRGEVNYIPLKESDELD